MGRIVTLECKSCTEDPQEVWIGQSTAEGPFYLYSGVGSRKEFAKFMEVHDLHRVDVVVEC